MRVPLTQRVRYGSSVLVTGAPGLGRQAMAYHGFRLATLLLIGVALLTPIHVASMLRAWDRDDRARSAATRDRVERTEADALGGVIIGAAGCALGVLTYPGYRRHELAVYHGRTRWLRHEGRGRRDRA